MPDDPGATDVDLLADLTTRQLLSAWETSPALVTVTVGPEHVLAFQNAASRSLFGARELGLPLCKAFPEMRPDSFEAMERVLREGVAVQRPRDPVGVHGRGGAELHLLYVFAPLGSAQPGAPSGVVMTAIDVSDRVDAERLALRARLLAEVSGQMAQATDADGALQLLTDALVPALADVAAVYVHPAGTALPLVAGTGRRPAPPAPGRCPAGHHRGAGAAGPVRTPAHVRPPVRAAPLGESPGGSTAHAPGHPSARCRRGADEQPHRPVAEQRRWSHRRRAAARGGGGDRRWCRPGQRRLPQALRRGRRAVPGGRRCPRRRGRHPPAHLRPAAPDRPRPATRPAA